MPIVLNFLGRQCPIFYFFPSVKIIKINRLSLTCALACYLRQPIFRTPSGLKQITMYSALYAASETLRRYLESQLAATPGLQFSSSGSRIVSLNSPQEMAQEMHSEGLSLWLYRVLRDDMRLNDPPERISPNQLRPPPLPVKLHYLVTPITLSSTATPGGSPNAEQMILGKAMQALHAKSILRGADLQADLAGTQAQLNVRLETLALDEIMRVWEALSAPYQLSVSYEMTLVNIDSGLEPEAIVPVDVALPDYAVIVGDHT